MRRAPLFVTAAVCAAALASGAFHAADADPQYAPATITLERLLAQARRAEGSLESGAYRRVSQTRSTAGDVWTSEHTWMGDDYKTTLRQGSFVSASGSLGGQQWEQDENGFVALTSGYEEQADPYAAAMQHTSGESEGEAVRLLGVLQSASPQYVVAVMPRPGLNELRFYDAKTYLLARVQETDYDGHQKAWAYSDYRAEAGRTVAHTVDYSIDGTPEFRTTLVSYQRVPATSVDLTIPTSRPLFALRDGDAVPIPAQFTPEGILVRVTIAGRGLDFVLDSGSSDLVIDADVARDMGLPVSGAVRESFAGDFTLSNTRVPDFNVGPLRAESVALASIAFHEQLEGQRIVGLLGTDFIASGALEVNFAKQTVTLRSSAPPGLQAAGWSALPLRLDSNVPMIDATFSGRPGHFIADLGADLTMLYPHYFSRFEIPVPKGATDQDQMQTIGQRSFGVKHFTMNRLLLGDLIFGDVQVTVPSASYAQDLDYDGLIGRDTLSNFNLIFDYKNRQLWFKQIDT